ncbi:MAG: hypothetical protein O3A00_00655 [Planctomycetota bacterium]|nr:hypothetical protein [Planctomycetota bacterium]
MALDLVKRFEASRMWGKPDLDDRRLGEYLADKVRENPEYK